jgi:hypothetical protein
MAPSVHLEYSFVVHCGSLRTPPTVFTHLLLLKDKLGHRFHCCVLVFGLIFLARRNRFVAFRGENS